MALRFGWLQKCSSKIDEEKRTDDLCMTIYISIEDERPKALAIEFGWRLNCSKK